MSKIKHKNFQMTTNKFLPIFHHLYLINSFDFLSDMNLKLFKFISSILNILNRPPIHLKNENLWLFLLCSLNPICQKYTTVVLIIFFIYKILFMRFVKFHFFFKHQYTLHNKVNRFHTILDKKKWNSQWIFFNRFFQKYFLSNQYI